MSATTERYGRIRPGDVAWEMFHDPHGRPTTPVRAFGGGEFPHILEAQFPPNFHAGDHWHPFDTIYIFTQGEMRVGGEGSYGPGDIRWVKAGHVYGPEEAGPEGVTFFLVALGGNVGLNWADVFDVPQELKDRLATFERPWGRVNIDDVPFVPFDDPAGRPTQPVQALLTDDPYLLRVKFVPEYVAGEHWHPNNTIYFITEGRMMFGDEGWYETGDIRWVIGGHSYGPEQPGSEGVTFLLISVGGEIGLNWSDLVPPPHGTVL